MYFTCTVNPAVDYFLTFDQLKIGALNRTPNGVFRLGGKGVIVSRVLNTLGTTTTATGFIGGFTGNFMLDSLHIEGVHTAFIPIESTARMNVILLNDVETDINTAGPTILDSDMDGLISFITKNLTAEDTFFLCGNKASGMDTYDYISIAQAVNQVGARLIIDTNTDLLTATLTEKPFLIKPNHLELSDIINQPVNTVEDCISGAKKLQEMGAQNVLVSRGGDGAVYIGADGNAYSVNVAKTTPGRQTIGAGDTMLASFVYGIDTLSSIEEALAYASAAGGATVESDDLATPELINQLLQEITVTSL